MKFNRYRVRYIVYVEVTWASNWCFFTSTSLDFRLYLCSPTFTDSYSYHYFSSYHFRYTGRVKAVTVAEVGGKGNSVDEVLDG